MEDDWTGTPHKMSACLSVHGFYTAQLLWPESSFLHMNWAVSKTFWIFTLRQRTLPHTPHSTCLSVYSLPYLFSCSCCNVFHFSIYFWQPSAGLGWNIVRLFIGEYLVSNGYLGHNFIYIFNTLGQWANGCFRGNRVSLFAHIFLHYAHTHGKIWLTFCIQ